MGSPVPLFGRGDTLWSIAEGHGVKLNNIIAANGMHNKDLVLAGERLVIPVLGQQSRLDSGLLSTPPAVAEEVGASLYSPTWEDLANQGSQRYCGAA